MKGHRYAVGLALLAFCASAGWATDSLGLDVTGGVGISGLDTTGSLDLKASEAKNPFEVSLSYAQQHITVGTESKTRQITGGVDHDIDDHWNAHGTLTYWKDTINDIHYAGPSAGLTYTWTDSAGAGPRSGPVVSKVETDSETDTALPQPNEFAALSLNTDLFFYSAEASGSSGSGSVAGRSGTSTSNDEKLTQFHPSATIEKPLFDQSVTPYATVGHYVYSRDPAALEDLVGRPHFGASPNQITGLVGGLFSNNGELGMRLALPWGIDSDARIGALQEATGNSWSTTQGVTLTRMVTDHIQAKLDWSRVIQEGVSYDFITGGLTYFFN